MPNSALMTGSGVGPTLSPVGDAPMSVIQAPSAPPSVTVTPADGVKVVTTTDVTTGSGGLLGKFAQFGNMTGIGLIFVMFAFGGYFLITNLISTMRESTTANSAALKDKIADDREDRNYQRQTHDRDMQILTSGMTKNTENTAALIAELKAGREASDRDIKGRQEAFEKRTEQQHQQIKELNDIIIKKMNP